MGQVNSSSGSEGNHGTDLLRRQETERRDKGLISIPDLQDENKRQDRKTVHCVKNRIDMLIEDCLNIKETTVVKTPNPQEESIDHKDGEIKSKNEQKLTEQVVKKEQNESGAVSNKIQNDNNNSETSGPEEKESTKHDCDIDQQPSNKVIVDNLEESNNKMNTKLLEATSEEKQNLIKKKTITTFQKFIDEVFDNSLHNMKEEEVKTASNFLKLCSDSLKADSEKQPLPVQSNEPEKLKEDAHSKIEVPNNKKITLKDHIERFLEASFKEEMEDKTQGSNPAPKNLNIHMLVNDMITNGLKLTSPSTCQNKDIQRKTQADQDTDKYQYLRGSPKRFSSHTEDLKSKVVVIDCDIDNDTTSKQNFVEKRQDKILPINSQPPNFVYFKTRAQNGQKPHPRESYKNNGTSPKLETGPMRHDPFDPRFADPKFQDNRIDIVSHDVNALSKREGQFNKQSIPRGEVSVASGSLTSHTVYQRSLHPQGPASPYGTNSNGPSSYHPSDHYNTAARSTVYPCHHVDCKCPSCLSHPTQSIQRDQYIENQRYQQSPNRVAQHFSPSDSHGSLLRGSSSLYPNEQSTYKVRPSHSQTVPMGQTTYHQSSPKLVPQRSPIPTPSEHHRSLRNSDYGTGVYSHARHQANFSEYPSQGQYATGRQGENPSFFTSEKYSRSVEENFNYKTKTEARNNHLVRPGTFHTKEHFPVAYSQGIRQRPEPDISKTIKHVENSDIDAAPLDLSVKRPSVEYDQFSQSGFHGIQQSFQSSQTKLSPSLTFIKHLENSVDKYCQELMSPASPTTFSRHAKPHLGSRSVSPTDRRSPIARYSPLPSPHGLSPQGLYPAMLQNRSLPSPHYSGGITMGQPLVDKSQSSQQSQAEMYGVGVGQHMATVPTQQVPHSQAIVQGQGGFMAPTLAQVNFDAAGKRNSNNISKHEPIQNIIGNHDSNDILYLYCKVCNSTYGSLYGFRKHFRNQHGFEPRAEHTIVHTISGTKSALHIPASIPNEMVRHGDRQIMTSILRNKTDDGFNNIHLKGHVLPNSDESKRSAVSPHLSSMTNRTSNKIDIPGKQKINNEQEEKNKTEQETKYLECPECGKTFQLNDFGSYKRHCRQHSHIKPFGCTDCHLSFTDQRSLKEHFKVHVKESHSTDGNRSDSSNSTDMAKHACSKCDKTFLTVAQLATHTESTHFNKVQNSVKNEKDSGEGRCKSGPVIAQTKDKHDNIAVPEMTQRILTTQSIVKQAAESMTAQVCPDSSWDKVDPKIRKNSEISLETCDSGYSSSVGSNLSQFCSEDSSSISDKKNGEKDCDVKGTKLESSKNESVEENYEIFYKHKKFYHPRKRERSISSNSGDATPNKVMKCSEVLPSSLGSIPVSSTTVNANSDSCDSQCMDNKGFDVSKIDKGETDEKLDKNIQESDLLNRMAMKAEARHNLPFVWDRTTRSRKTK